MRAPPDRPNLFQFAYAEHAQDAVLAWLLTWADPRFEPVDAGLHAAGRLLLTRLLALYPGTGNAHVDSVKVQQQLGGVDVLVVVNEQIAVVIEDKIDSSIRKNQLDTYLASLRATNSYRSVDGVFVKTGDQDPVSAREVGYPVLLRHDLLHIIEEGLKAGAKHDALYEYRDRLVRFERDTASYATQPLALWGTDENEGISWEIVRERRSRWAGFFTALQPSLLGSHWGYVPNQSGGFMGLWWASTHDGEAWTYIQLEDERLVFKLNVDDAARRGAIRWQWHERVLVAAQAADLPVQRPRRFGSGTTMTAAYLEDYRQPNSSGLLNLDATLSVLRQAEHVLDAARALS